MYTWEMIRDITEDILQNYHKEKLDLIARLVDVADDMLKAKQALGQGQGAAEFRERLVDELKKREADD